MKKALASLLALLLISMMIPALAEGSAWDFDAEYYVLRKYTGSGGDVVVPGQIGTGTVDVIDGSAFSSGTITSLVLPDTLLELRQSAVSWCAGLRSVTLPDSLIVIGAQNLYSCDALTEVTIPAGVRYIGPRSLAYCASLSSVTFEGVCPVIGAQCFTQIAGDAVIRVPDDQLDAYQQALTAAGCQAAIVPSGRNAVQADNNGFNAADFDFDASTGTITSYNGYATYLRIPESIDGTPVRAIGPEAFARHYYLALLELPEGLETIGESAFAWCGTLQYVSFPTTLKAIGDKAFANGYKGCALELPHVETIGAHAFQQSLIEGQLTLPEGLKTIGEGAFERSAGIQELSLPATLESAADSAFADDWSLTYVYMDGLTPPALGENVFAGCALADIDLNEHCTRQQMLDMQACVDAMGLSCRVWRNQNTQTSYPTDGLSTYDGCLMTGYTGSMTHIRPYDTCDDVDITGLADGALRGNQVVEYFAVPHSDVFTTIGAEAFMDSAIRHVDLFDSVTTIGARAFSGCAQLEELILPASVTEIGADAFAGLTSLKKVTILCDASLLPEGSFASCAALTEAYVAKGAIPARLFEGSALTTLSLGEGVTAIGDSAFANTGLTSADLTHVQTIGKSAFASAPLTGVTLAEGANIGEYAFARTKLARLVIPAGCEMPLSALEGIDEGADIRLSADATDEQLDLWNERLARPWNKPLRREGEASAPAIDVPAEYVGTWYGVTLEMEGTAYQLADIGMRFTLVLEADGMLLLDTGDEQNVVICTMQSGVLMAGDALLTLTGDGLLRYAEGGNTMLLSREQPEAIVIQAAPADETAVLTDFLGVWTAVRVSMEGMTLPAEAAGMAEDTLVIRSGSCDLSMQGMVLEALPCRMDGHVLLLEMLGTDVALTLHTDSTVSLTMDDTILWYERTGDVTDAPSAPGPAAVLDTRYVMTDADVNGFNMSAAMLGGMEYSFVLHSDGTVNFVLAGTELPLLTWTEGEDGYIIDYYGQPLNLVRTDKGFDMDYLGSMLMHFAPQGAQ